MLEHIVKNGETIHDILNMYHLELKEIQGVNLHITDFYNIQTGMKIKIPLINNEIEQILDNTESFVQKYYPKVNELYEEKTIPPAMEERISEAPSIPTMEVKERVEVKPELPKGRPYPGILPPRGSMKKSSV